MRFARTRTYFIAAALTASFVALVGCAAGDADGGKVSTPTSEDRATGESTPATAQVPAPKFEPKFDDKTPDPSKDPAPPDGDQCTDADDPGGAENTATTLAATDDCNDTVMEVTGKMKGAADVDMYKLSVKDRSCGIFEASFEDETAGTELCVFARCQNSTQDAFGGCKAGTEAVSDIGVKGCCAAAPGKAIPKIDCDGFNDSVDYSIRVRQPAGNQCLPYKFKYSF